MSRSGPQMPSRMPSMSSWMPFMPSVMPSGVPFMPSAMPSRAILVSIWLMLLGGCSDRYTCPDPIGPIVRDDCDVYQTRYEALKVELGVTFAGVGVGVDVGDQSIRDPSELLQVLKLQTMALCRDFNACRVQPDEYRARREALDTRYASIIALTEQLRAADDRATRRQLVSSLVEILRKPIDYGGDAPAPTGKRRSPFRRTTSMWIGGQNVHPPPADLPRATPALAWWQPIAVRGVGRSGQTRIFLRFRGPAAADDFAYAILPDGTEARCPVRPDGPRGDDAERALQGRASCDFEGLKTPPESGRLTVDYRPGLTGERHRLGSVPLDAAARAAEAWLAYLPSPIGEEPIDHERPWLVVHLDKDREQNVTMRCEHGDAPVGGPIRAQVASRRVAGLHRFHLPLPISLPRSGSAVELPGDLDPEKAAGRWSCRISALGEHQRTVDFVLGEDGRPVLPEAQAAPAAGRWVSPPWWPLAPLR